MLFDIRGMKDKNKVLKRLLVFKGNTKNVTSAFLSPLTGNKLLTVCYDNKIRLYDASGQEYVNGFPVATIHHNTETGRWLTKFRAEWHPRREDLFFIGSMNHPRRIEAFSETGKPYASLRGDDLGTVCSIVKCHPSQEIVVGGNSSG